jgi:hypothetical protein
VLRKAVHRSCEGVAGEVGQGGHSLQQPRGRRATRTVLQEADKEPRIPRRRVGRRGAGPARSSPRERATTLGQNSASRSGSGWNDRRVAAEVLQDVERRTRDPPGGRHGSGRGSAVSRPR